jgi:hypothetical protein
MKTLISPLLAGRMQKTMGYRKFTFGVSNRCQHLHVTKELKKSFDFYLPKR